jgi:ubiquinone/menaquinone biosynthesis C-methylase UbiE
MFGEDNLIPQYVGQDHSFDPAAAYYAHRPDYPKAFYNELQSMLGRFKNGRVIDLGCGDARIASHVAHMGAEVLAVDLSERMLSAAAKRLQGLSDSRVYLLQGEAGRLPFPSGTVDAVLIGQAFHWMSKESVAREVARVLKPHGLWGVFWIQPVNPLPLSVQVSDTLIARFISGYDPDTAHNLVSKNRIPAHFGFQVRTWSTEFSHKYQLEDYVTMVMSKSYVAASLNSENAVAFKKNLSQHLESNCLVPTVEERYLLTACFAEHRSDDELEKSTTP